MTPWWIVFFLPTNSKLSFDAVTQRFLQMCVMLLCSVGTLRPLTGSRPSTELKNKVFHALANRDIPLSDREEYWFPLRLSVCPSVCLFICLLVRTSVHLLVNSVSVWRTFASVFALCKIFVFRTFLPCFFFREIDLKFVIWIFLDIIQIKFNCCLVWPIYAWVMVLCRNSVVLFSPVFCDIDYKVGIHVYEMVLTYYRWSLPFVAFDLL